MNTYHHRCGWAAVYPVATSGDFVTVEDSLGREHIVMRGDLDMTTETEA